ncbi:MAG: hypothetical protein COC06_01545 [Bacteroidales bacterium]|nr:MAG: hypothetical protein COC06_12670 [Bacteroidales bacterium]PCH71345.1 MAG: hypothetical protein COC06_01545 [Bacteroidales bacterium]
MKIGDENIEKIILESAKDLLFRYGVKGWNMDNLARESGMSKRTLYKIIGNKEDLLYKCHSDGLDKNTLLIKKYFKQDKDYCILLDGLSEEILKGIDEFIVASSKTIKTEYPRIEKMIKEKLKIHTKLYIDFYEKGKSQGFLKDNINSNIINNIMITLMKYNLFESKDKSAFESTIKEELDFLFMVIRK